MSNIQTIGVLTSGGDAPGMNAAVRAVVREALFQGMEVIGINRGYAGLLEEDMFRMTAKDVSETIARGGTVLQTARCDEFTTPEGVKKGADICRKWNMDAIVVIGGDGSFRGALDLSREGIGVIGVPGTIDNDIGCTEYAIGYDTALNTARDAIDRLRDTATSHQKCSVVEVMGRHAGYIALSVGIATGAEAILVPEQEINWEQDLIQPILEGMKLGKQHFIVVVAEGIRDREKVESIIKERTGAQIRTTILGHVQRGGSPTAEDRIMASRFGAKAVWLLAEGKTNRVVALKENRVCDFSVEEALGMKKTLDPDLLRLAKELI